MGKRKRHLTPLILKKIVTPFCISLKLRIKKNNKIIGIIEMHLIANTCLYEKCRI